MVGHSSLQNPADHEFYADMLLTIDPGSPDAISPMYPC